MLEYAEGGWIFEGSGPVGGIGEAVSRRYLSDVVAGLMYLHQHVGLCFCHSPLQIGCLSQMACFVCAFHLIFV